MFLPAALYNFQCRLLDFSLSLASERIRSLAFPMKIATQMDQPHSSSFICAPFLTLPFGTVPWRRFHHPHLHGTRNSLPQCVASWTPASTPPDKISILHDRDLDATQRVCLLLVAPQLPLWSLRKGGIEWGVSGHEGGLVDVGRRGIGRRRPTRCRAPRRLACRSSRKGAWIWTFPVSVERPASSTRAYVPRRTLWAGTGPSTSCRTSTVVLPRRITWTRSPSR